MQALSKSIDTQAHHQAQEARELRQQVMDLSQALSGEIRKLHAEAAKKLDQAVGELENGKVARTALSEILLEMAVRLSDELAARLGRAGDKLQHG